ncbi:leucine--tRNA ligase, partial [Candidatus Roizmanbacteria bacterium RIFCSPHIGHO2_02_FULL_37_24]
MYLPHEIEPKWQKKWMETGIYNASDTSKAQKSYILVEFPYPSGERLHVGHARSYCSIDAVARLKRMQGFNVMYPFGWDAFGLPAENYAIKTGIHPSITVAENIKKSKAQVISWGLSFDWDREINTTDPNYYKWTQWIFLQLYNAGLAYRDEIAVNWCPSCKTNLANEEVVAGKCERCGHVTKRRTQKQWLLKITAYSERLLNDLTAVDYRNDIKIQQINWIGRKEGVSIDYPVIDSDEVLKCFTTRPDTNFGASFIALAPEHRLAKLISDVDHKVEVKKYIEISIKKSELERQEGKIKTGVFTGRYVLNRLNNEKLPIYIADYVLHSVGTSAIVGVPAHDIRDFEFANKFKLNAKRVVLEKGNTDLNNVTNTDEVYEGEGTIVNSGFLNDLDSEQGLQVVIDFLEKNGFGKRSTTYHLRDWVFSRQHYWGEPIPVVYCEKCGIVTIPEKDLPVVLPYLE